MKKYMIGYDGEDIESPVGDWCKWEDVETELQAANETIAELHKAGHIQVWMDQKARIAELEKALNLRNAQYANLKQEIFDSAHHIAGLEAEVAELRSRYLGIDKTYALVQDMRTQTAQEICEWIEDGRWWSDALGKVNLLLTIRVKYGIEEEK